MVVTPRPFNAPTGRTQDRTGLPSTCTVHAPHCAMPQPYLVPVIPMMSRSTQSSGMSAGASKDFCSPLMVSVVAISIPKFYGRGPAAPGEDWKYRAAASQEARIFSAMLICIADAAHHRIVQRDCISFNRTDTIVVIECARLLRHVN